MRHWCLQHTQLTWPQRGRAQGVHRPPATLPSNVRSTIHIIRHCKPSATGTHPRSTSSSASSRFAHPSAPPQESPQVPSQCSIAHYTITITPPGVRQSVSFLQPLVANVASYAPERPASAASGPARASSATSSEFRYVEKLTAHQTCLLVMHLYIYSRVVTAKHRLRRRTAPAHARIASDTAILHPTHDAEVHVARRAASTPGTRLPEDGHGFGRARQDDVGRSAVRNAVHCCAGSHLLCHHGYLVGTLVCTRTRYWTRSCSDGRPAKPPQPAWGHRALQPSSSVCTVRTCCCMTCM